MEVRYADNLAFLTHSVDEGHGILGFVREHLREVNLALKEDNPGIAIDLTSGHQTDLLGTVVRLRDKRLQYGPGPDAWTKLNSCLAKAWETPEPQKSAIAGINGWVASFGMTFGSGEMLRSDILQHAFDFGFRELNDRDLEEGWHASCVRWQECRKKAFQKHGIS